MKIKKSLIITGAFLITLATLITSSFAATSHKGVYGIKLLREAGEGYKMAGNVIWKVVKYNNIQDEQHPQKNEGVVDWSRSVYCIKAGVGFGASSDNIPEVEQDRVYYGTESILTPVAIGGVGSGVNRLLGANLDGKNLNSLIWLLDHIYLPKHTNAEEKKLMKDELLTNAFAQKIEEGEINSIDEVELTDDQMEAVFQLAVWYFTNSDEPKYHVSDLTTINKTTDPTGSDSESVEIETQQDMKTLYKYLIETAEKEAALYNVKRVAPTIVQDTGAVAAVTVEGNKTIIGPIKVNITNGENIYGFSVNVTAKSGDQGVSNSYKVLKDNKQDEAKTIEDINGKNIYISIDNANVTSATVNFTGKYAKTTITKLEAGDGTQPLAVVEKEFVPLNTSITAQKEEEEKPQELDLSLRKFISKVDGENVVPSREPVVDKTPLRTGSGKTANYTHSKTPVSVKNGSEVTYTLRIYNEGETSGFAKEVSDTIPEGLEFLPQNSTNISYGWKMYKKSGDALVQTEIPSEATIIKTDHLSKAKGEQNLIPGYNKETDTLSYKDLQLVFKVVEPDSSERVLKNIAEITADEDKDGKEVSDRDSTPDSSIKNPSSYPDDNNVQDDDDFEKLVLKEFDLSLRKFISEINDEPVVPSRAPEVNVAPLKSGGKNATYTHSKNAVGVKTGDIVVYTLRVYNEGEVDGYAKEITDNIPEGLAFDDEIILHPINIQYEWKLSQDGTKITTNYLARDQEEPEMHKLEGFDPKSSTQLDYEDVKVAFKVIEPNTSSKALVNTAEISDDEDKDGNPVKDRDSEPNNGIETEDDTDKEYVNLKYFDLSLRKFINTVNGHEVQTSREPAVDVSKIKDGTDTTATYTQPKDAVSVTKGNKVVYTIRAYNEGKLAGYATEITDILPEGLEFVPASESEINTKYGWEVSADGRKVTTNYLANTLIKAFDKETDETLDYKDVQIECKVVGEAGLRNIAEISKAADEEKKEVPDADSVPNNVDKDHYNPPTDNSSYQEDDDDYEDLAVRKFDLSLRKFITKINDKETDARVPEVSLGEDGKLKYEQSKEPLNVAANDIIIYTIRVYNEGEVEGYAKEVTDNVPEGLVYLPENEINTKYGWKLSADGKEITTDYLSKEKSEARNEDNLLKAFDKEKEISSTNPDYRDLQVAFRITETNLSSNRTIINIAEITEDEDKNGDPVEDEDSDPGNKDPEEDDLDKETVKVGYFDLSLLKWVSSVYVTEDGKTTVRKTGHTGAENPEPVVKVDIYRKKMEDVTVKFGYTIKVTNEGEIEGYATEISDYIPEGLKFDKKDNPNWEEKGGKIVTRALENKLLKPGESAEVEVILTWINGTENIGVKTNVAEISEDKNDHNAKDIDSTPNNKKDGEDDIDEAPVMIAVQTGGADDIPKYAALGAVVLAILGTGIYLIKKYVL